MKRRIYGLENEYGIACTVQGRRRMQPEDAARHLFRRFAFSGRSSNAFLENGARFYLDVGSHPEYATPECDNLWDLVTQDKAGERFVEDLCNEAVTTLRQEGVHADIYVFRNNTDSAGNTYGCHENYLTPRSVDFARLTQLLVPFFVTRQLYAGAGKVLRTSRGAMFCMAQRSEHMWELAAVGTTRSRPIINTRDEPHADVTKYRRLHVIVGDANMSEYTTFLKVGVTSILLRMIEDRRIALPDLQLENAMRAIRDISHDIDLKQKVNLAGGRQYSAVEIQMAYLEKAEVFAQRQRLNPDEELALAYWRECLDALAGDPFSKLDTRIDWIIKHNLIEGYRKRHGGLSLGDPRIAAIDLQYHDVNRNRGIFYKLQGGGQVERVTDDDKVTAARVEPPNTRAKLRGEFIRVARERRRDVTADWAHLKINDNQKSITLNDPFATESRAVRSLIDAL